MLKPLMQAVDDTQLKSLSPGISALLKPDTKPMQANGHKFELQRYGDAKL